MGIREIIFRAKDYTGEWRYGYLVQEVDIGNKPIKNFIIENTSEVSILNKGLLQKYYEIDSNTVGQYTGLKDKNGKRIFEGDILRNPRNDLFVVRYICGRFDCEPIKEFYKQPKISWNTLGELQNASWVEDNTEVIGNIYDNSNLLPMETK